MKMPRGQQHQQAMRWAPVRPLPSLPLRQHEGALTASQRTDKAIWTPLQLVQRPNHQVVAVLEPTRCEKSIPIGKIPHACDAAREQAQKGIHRMETHVIAAVTGAKNAPLAVELWSVTDFRPPAAIARFLFVALALAMPPQRATESAMMWTLSPVAGVLVALLVVAFVPSATAVDHSKFRTCAQTGFCRRHREVEAEPAVRVEAAACVDERHPETRCHRQPRGQCLDRASSFMDVHCINTDMFVVIPFVFFRAGLLRSGA